MSYVFMDSFYTNWPKRIYVYASPNPPENPNSKYYKVLGIQPNVDLCTIKKAYRRLVLVAHPDKGGSQAHFLRIREAYEALVNPLPQPSDQECK